jgi:hypothetical protein
MFPNGGSYQDIDCNSNCDVNGHSEDGVQEAENPVMHEFTEEVSDFPLDRCMQLLPHDQNPGAFFIALLQKVLTCQLIYYMISVVFLYLSNPKKEIQRISMNIENSQAYVFNNVVLYVIFHVLQQLR